MMHAEKVAFCDLDGTLVLDNSFHIFMASCWKKGSGGQRFGLSLQVAPRVLGKLAGGHASLKRRILTWFAAQPPLWQEAVIAHTVSRLMPTISLPILRILQDIRSEGGYIVLATAAPDVYARTLATQIGAVTCLATVGRPGPGWKELLAAQKSQACKAWLMDTYPERAVHVTVLTDHPDDLPLLELADHAVLQASAAGLDHLRAQMAKRPTPQIQEITTIDVHAVQEGGGMWLWFDDRPEGPHNHWEVRTILSKHRHARLYAGEGVWRPIRPGQKLVPVGLRRDCPRPPSSRERVIIHMRRRIIRDWLRIFH